jgi:hypothetical protein
MSASSPRGDDLVQMAAALANPLRLRIVATLAGGRDYVSHLAREIGVSRPCSTCTCIVWRPPAWSSGRSSSPRTARP